MSKKRVLFVTQEMNPYTTISEISNIVRQLAPFTQGQGMEVRVLMPKYGSINERRHRLHEVVRLSGMNIIVDDDDYPLIIKVASLPGARLQVYFLDMRSFSRENSFSMMKMRRLLRTTKKEWSSSARVWSRQSRSLDGHQTSSIVMVG